MTTPNINEYFNGGLDEATAKYFETSYKPDGKAPNPDDYFQAEQPETTPAAPDMPINYDSDTPQPANYFEIEPDEYQAKRDANMSRMTEEQQRMQYLIKMALASNN